MTLSKPTAKPTTKSLNKSKLNSLPNFLHIQPSSSDENAYPVCVSWSLDDGSIKSVQIMPDEDWDPWENSDSEIDVQHLFDQGVSGPDLIRELNEDLDAKTVFIAGFDYEDELAETLFETYGFELGFELARLTELFKEQDIEQIIAIRQDIAFEHGLKLEDSEDIVRSHVFMSDQLL